MTAGCSCGAVYATTSSGEASRLHPIYALQLQVFGGCADPKPLARALEAARIEAVLYADVSDPRGVGLLAFAEDPAFFVTRLRDTLACEPFAALGQKPALTMFGRSYSSGFEPDLEDWLLHGPRRTVLNPAWP